jgi:hypothetical protein
VSDDFPHAMTAISAQQKPTKVELACDDSTLTMKKLETVAGEIEHQMYGQWNHCAIHESDLQRLRSGTTPPTASTRPLALARSSPTPQTKIRLLAQGRFSLKPVSFQTCAASGQQSLRSALQLGLCLSD